MSRANDAAKYLAQLAVSRAAYRQLVKRALELLPPADLSKGEERLVCFDSMAKLGKAIGVSRTTVRGDLERLCNYQWITVEDDAYLLGRRENGQLYLLADLAADAAVGEEGLVSRRVVADLLPAREEAPERVETRPMFRGSRRRWSPDA